MTILRAGVCFGGVLMLAGVGAAEVPVAVARQQVTVLALAVTAYARDVGSFPGTADGLRVLVERPTGPAAASWKGPYLEPAGVPRDPWGNAYGYSVRPDDAARPFSVYSCGPDGRSRSAGNDPDDVGVWPVTPVAAATPSPLLPRRLRGPLAWVVVLTIAVALLRRYAGRVARQPQPHVDGYVRRHRRDRRRAAATPVRSEGQDNLKV
jgi:general secretion pathway protein G